MSSCNASGKFYTFQFYTFQLPLWELYDRWHFPYKCHAWFNNTVLQDEKIYAECNSSKVDARNRCCWATHIWRDRMACHSRIEGSGEFSVGRLGRHQPRNVATHHVVRQRRPDGAEVSTLRRGHVPRPTAGSPQQGSAPLTRPQRGSDATRSPRPRQPWRGFRRPAGAERPNGRRGLMPAQAKRTDVRAGA